MICSHSFPIFCPQAKPPFCLTHSLTNIYWFRPSWAAQTSTILSELGLFDFRVLTNCNSHHKWIWLFCIIVLLSLFIIIWLCFFFLLTSITLQFSQSFNWYYNCSKHFDSLIFTFFIFYFLCLCFVNLKLFILIMTTNTVSLYFIYHNKPRDLVSFSKTQLFINCSIVIFFIIFYFVIINCYIYYLEIIYFIIWLLFYNINNVKMTCQLYYSYCYMCMSMSMSMCIIFII